MALKVKAHNENTWFTRMLRLIDISELNTRIKDVWPKFGCCNFLISGKKESISFADIFYD